MEAVSKDTAQQEEDQKIEVSYFGPQPKPAESQPAKNPETKAPAKIEHKIEEETPGGLKDIPIRPPSPPKLEINNGNAKKESEIKKEEDKD